MDPLHTSAPGGGTAPPITSVQPVWIRLPKPGGMCPWTGLSRSKLFEMLQTGEIETVSLKREPKAKRGARVIKLASMLAYMDKLAGGKEGED
jgi:hypothetical protein